MTSKISDTPLSQLSQVVMAQMGLHFPSERWRDLERGIISAAREFGFKDAESCIQWLVSSPLTKTQIGILASHLTVGETYFFREGKSFEVLQEHILSDLIGSRRGSQQRLRIWSAGCSTGEEPYSIAILLSTMMADLNDWNITILATDINPRILDRAAKGVYNEWSFRGTPRWIKERYFKKRQGGRFEVLPQIKQMVTFSFLNLAEDDYPSLWNNTNAMDIIFCRNVLMYFAPERAKKVVQHLYRCLVDGGWLMVSPSETSQALFAPLVTINFPDVILYAKDGQHSQKVKDFLPKEIPAPILPSEITIPKQPPAAEAALETIFSSPGITGAVEEPKSADGQSTLYAEALTLYEQGHYAPAAERLAQVLAHDQEAGQVMTLLVRAYANQGRLAEALQWCDKLLAVEKLNSKVHYLRAMILQEQGAVSQAALALKRALYTDPDFVLAHFALGNLALREGRFTEADKHFQNALRLLHGYRQEDLLPEAEGLTAGRLAEVIRSTTFRGNRNEENANSK
jgi:chemotaxis protein methyltransferase CheR